jgi:hypothetical protein
MAEQPTGKALEDLRRQRDEQREDRAAAAAYDRARTYPETPKAPKVEKKAKGGMVGSASKRADGIAQRGKTKGRMV